MNPAPFADFGVIRVEGVVELGKSHNKDLAAMKKQLAVLRLEASKASKKERVRAEELKEASKMEE